MRRTITSARRVRRILIALFITVVATIGITAAASAQAVRIELKLRPSPPRVGVAHVSIRVTSSDGHPVALQHAEAFVSWWDPTLGPAQIPPTPMVPMGEMPREHIIVDVGRGTGNYTIAVPFTRPGHWAILVHGATRDASYVAGYKDVIVRP